MSDLRLLLQQTIQNDQLFTKEHHLLVTVSGGIDSMVLVHSLKALGYTIQVAHCNFKLRGADADADEQFVQSYCADHQIRCHTIAFDTKAYKKEHQCSTQEAARTLRYEWFESLRKKEGLDYILTAHHEDDAIETLFINLIRGTGLRGLTALALKTETLIRPLLHINRALIEAYAIEEQISYREDLSNKSLVYQRNRLRQEVLPYLYQQFPSLRTTLPKSLEQLRFAKDVMEEALILKTPNSLIKHQISKSDLLQEKHPASMLYEWLKRYNFNPDQCQQIYKAIEHIGAHFYSTTHQLLIDREWLFIRSLTAPIRAYELLVEHISPQEILDLKSEPNTAYVDADTVRLPLHMRYYQTGDYFTPQGFKTSQKLSLFFKKQKLSQFEKQQIPLIVDADNQIVWVYEKRIANPCCLTSKTKTILRLTLNGI